MSKLRKVLAVAGVAAVGAVGTKLAVDYLKNRGEEKAAPESDGDQDAASAEQIAYVKVEQSSVQDFLDKSFGNPGRYVPNRPPKLFEYQGRQYMVIWARDNDQNKNQMLAFEYQESGRSMIASVGYTTDATDYDLKLTGTPFAIEVNDQKIASGKGETAGTSDVDLVLA